MTILYKPVLIESVEQAEKLPVGTVAVRYDEQDRIWSAARRCCCESVDCDVWFLTGNERPAGHEYMIEATALVPVEARRQYGHDPIDPDIERAPSPDALRYVTPWESA